MICLMKRGLFFLAVLAMATPAFAQSQVSVPEPSDIGLFALGVAGLIIGRRSSRRPPRDHDEDA